MISINSLSGGKTSSFMACQYPANYNIFSLIRIEADYCKPKDANLVKYISEKIGMDFIATAESDQTLYVVRDLEQIIGKEIIWVTGISFEELCNYKNSLPNIAWRFCTTELKMMPIANWWLKNLNDKIKMRIGIRYDEKERANNLSNEIKLIVGKHKNGNNKWQTFDWRENEFPLIDDKIFHHKIFEWSKNSGLNFPNDSNCVGCFWKPVQQLRKNWDDEPLKMKWFSELENKYFEKNTWKFKKDIKYDQIKSIGLQQDFIFGTGSGCNAGYCTD